MTNSILALLFASLAACSPQARLGGSESLEEGNGVGYPGGDEVIDLFAGEFYVLEPNNTCFDSYDGVRRNSYVSKMTIKTARRGAIYDFGPCRRKRSKGVKRSHVDVSVYNPDYLGHGGRIYVKRMSPPSSVSETERYPEAFCKSGTDSYYGLDIVIENNRAGTAPRAIAYYRDFGMASGAVVDMGPVTRTSPAPLSYHYENADLTLDIDASARIRENRVYQGRLSTELGGKEIQDLMLNCRVANYVQGN